MGIFTKDLSEKITKEGGVSFILKEHKNLLLGSIIINRNDDDDMDVNYDDSDCVAY